MKIINRINNSPNMINYFLNPIAHTQSLPSTVTNDHYELNKTTDILNETRKYFISRFR